MCGGGGGGGGGGIWRRYIAAPRPGSAHCATDMPGPATLLVLVCFTLGAVRHAYADQQLLEPAPAPAEGRRALSGLQAGPGGLQAGPGGLQGARSGGGGVQGAYNLVQCYACTRCEAASNSSNKLCPYSPNALTQGRCVIYAEKYNEGKENSYVRGCASELGTCSDLKRLYESKSQFVQLVSCAECEGDLCNGAPRGLVDVTMALLTLVIVPILGKCTLA